MLLIVNTANQQEYNRKWSIRIRQIPCKSQYRGNDFINYLSPLTNEMATVIVDDFIAPAGCLQYYTALNGNIESFNYRTTNLPVVTSTTPKSIQIVDTKIANNYLNNLNYGVCIAKHPRICAIRYSAIEFDFGGSLADSSTPGDKCISTQTLASDGDFLVIPFGTDQLKSNLIDRYCGQRFSPTPTAALTNADVYCKLFFFLKSNYIK